MLLRGLHVFVMCYDIELEPIITGFFRKYLWLRQRGWVRGGGGFSGEDGAMTTDTVTVNGNQIKRPLVGLPV